MYYERTREKLATPKNLSLTSNGEDILFLER